MTDLDQIPFMINGLFLTAHARKQLAVRAITPQEVGVCLRSFDAFEVTKNSQRPGYYLNLWRDKLRVTVSKDPSGKWVIVTVAENIKRNVKTKGVL